MEATLDTQARALVNEFFALRDHELISVVEDRPTEGRFLAVMLRSVPHPPGPFSTISDLTGLPVHAEAVLSAAWRHVDQRWVWSMLSPASKEQVGDLMDRSGVERDRWYYLTITEGI